jgi:hypothetical protein
VGGWHSFFAKTILTYTKAGISKSIPLALDMNFRGSKKTF